MLITPLASLRYSLGTVSGISATIGPRADCLKRLKPTTAMTNASREVVPAYGNRANPRALRGSSTITKGILRPRRVRVLSLQAVTSGMSIRAMMLSMVINAPISPREATKPSRKTGTYVS
jgi:hypothetical protein